MNATAYSTALSWFTSLRYGLMIHFGLYSRLGRGEWVLNREEIPLTEYRGLAKQFTANQFDAEAICQLALAGGMRYVVMTTMHHDGFRLYDTNLSRYSSHYSPCGRDLVAELVSAARRLGLGIGLYHSLNNWNDHPDGADALEDPRAQKLFVDAAHARIRELCTNYDFDIMWYDGWWPFDAQGWRAEELNLMARSLRPRLLFNPRNGLPGDFATPEGHLAYPTPWRPWEAVHSLNNSWGFHAGDDEWKSPTQVIDLLTATAAGRGNLLLNVGLNAEGGIPEIARTTLTEVGTWLKSNGQAIYDTTDVVSFDLRTRGNHLGDWNHHGSLTITGTTAQVILRRWPGPRFSLGGLQGKVARVDLSGHGQIAFRQLGSRLELTLPERRPDGICPVLSLHCQEKPRFYQTGGLRVPRVEHPHYDPCPSELAAAPGVAGG